MRKRAMARWTTGLLGGLAILGAQAQTTASGVADASPQLARGWIVKLKDSKPQPVVRLAAAAVPSDGAVSQRNRLWQAAIRQRVGMLAHKPTAFGAQVVHTGRLMTVAEAEAEAQRLRQDPDVEWVVVNAIERRQSTPWFPDGPNDPAYASQIWLSARSQASETAGVANFRDAWDRMRGWLNGPGAGYTRSLSTVAVAVLDSGTLDAVAPVTYQRIGPHPELYQRLYAGYDFVSELEYSRDGNGIDADPNDPGDGLTRREKARNPLLYPPTCSPQDSSWHGFSIINMLAAKADNSLFGAGMLAPLPGEVVIPVRVGSVCGADRSDIIEGMLWAAGVAYQGSPAPVSRPARVISLSYGGSEPCSSRTGYPAVIQTLRQRGVLVVASAGNGNSDGVGDTAPTVPAACPGVLAVTALHQRGTKATYANFVATTPGDRWGLSVAAGDVANGDFVNGDGGVLALSNAGRREPGTDLDEFRTLQSDQFTMVRLAGTSFASPQVAGVAALMLAIDPSLTLDELLVLLTQSARQPFPVVPGLPLCSEANRGACNCTADTCGSGILDAASAVAAVMGRLENRATPPVAYMPDAGSTSSFVPDRLRSSGGGGGGGSMSLVWGAALLALVAWQAWAVRCQTAVDVRTGRL